MLTDCAVECPRSINAPPPPHFPIIPRTSDRTTGPVGGVGKRGEGPCVEPTVPCRSGGRWPGQSGVGVRAERRWDGRRLPLRFSAEGEAPRPSGGPVPHTGGRGVVGDALEGKGPRRPPQKRLDRRLEEVDTAVGGGWCRLPMPLKLALGTRATVAGHRLGALEGGGGYLLPLPMHPWGWGGGVPDPVPLCLAPAPPPYQTPVGAPAPPAIPFQWAPKARRKRYSPEQQAYRHGRCRTELLATAH